MGTPGAGDVRGHVFICYVREDSGRVDRLQGVLRDAGIDVWRDTGRIWPGQDWRLEIRDAIRSGSLAFIACFSENSECRQSSYQNQELVLAVEQMRERRPGVPWLIPVRFAECAIPAFDLGAGRMLDSLQHIDLFDGAWDQGIPRLIGAVHRILAGPPAYRAAGSATPSLGDCPAPAAGPQDPALVPPDEAGLAELRDRGLAAARRDLSNCSSGQVPLPPAVAPPPRPHPRQAYPPSQSYWQPAGSARPHPPVRPRWIKRRHLVLTAIFAYIAFWGFASAAGVIYHAPRGAPAANVALGVLALLIAVYLSGIHRHHR